MFIKKNYEPQKHKRKKTRARKENKENIKERRKARKKARKKEHIFSNLIKKVKETKLKCKTFKQIFILRRFIFKTHKINLSIKLPFYKSL